MFEANTWRVRPDELFTFGRAKTCNAVLPNDDRGVSRNAGSFEWRAGSWWLVNTSASSMLYLSGDRGFRADIPPGMALPLQQWHAKVRLDGILESYTLRMRLPDLDDEEDSDLAAEMVPERPERTVTSTKLRAPLNDADRLVLAARFEEYLTWRHSGPVAPRSAREAAERIGWQPHTVAKRCENIRNRYVRDRRSWFARSACARGARRAAHLHRRAHDRRPAAPAADGPPPTAQPPASPPAS